MSIAYLTRRENDPNISRTHKKLLITILKNEEHFMHVVGLSGAQGGGKTSLLGALEGLGARVDHFKVSRTAQEQLGWTSLDQVLVCPKAMVEFQQLVFDLKYKNDKALADAAPNNETILVERTFADIATYASHWAMKFVNRGWTIDEAVNFSRDFIKRCANAHEEIYDCTLLLPMMSHVKWEDDPHRAKQDTATQIYAGLNDFFIHVLQKHHRFFITEKSIEARALQTQQHLIKAGLWHFQPQNLS